MTSDTTIKALLETFQECTTRGENATLILETRNGVQFATLKVKLPVSPTSRTPAKTRVGSTATKRKSPSTLKRDRERLENYVKNKSLQESWGPTTSTPTINKNPQVSQPVQASCSLVMEMPNEVSCDAANLQEVIDKENNDDGVDEGEKKFSWNEENTQKIMDMFENKGGLFSSKFSFTLPVTLECFNKHENLEQNDPEDQDNNDNMDDVKIWAIKQKQSCKPTDFN